MLAKKQTISIALAMLTAALMVSACFAVAEGETVKVQGVVSVTKEADVVKAVQLATDADVYSVELDDQGMAMGEMDGKKVEVEGMVSEQDGQKWIKVLSFTAVAE
jgi:DNA/RNA endonuclease YhcR with UshA esterase domain